MRYAIYTAVSTRSQAAPDKVSLSQQETLARQTASARGWLETSGPFTVPGESRTRWVNLRDAETAIPSIKHMLDSAQHKDFDLLILYDYSRLRELLDPVSKTLSAYGIQIYSLSQPVEPIPPEQYEHNATADTLQFVSGFTSRAEIETFRRRYKLGMPKRIAEKGLPKGSISYGYRKPPGRETDRKAIPIQDTITAPIVTHIKDLFLSGSSLWQIAHHLTSQGIPTPRRKTKWTDVHVRRILKNRYYSGEVYFGKTRRITDPRTGTASIILNPPSKLITATGAHTPLWDAHTQLRIEEEFTKRGKHYSGSRTQRLSNLLHCGICGARVWVQYPGGYYTDHGRRWACSADPKHVTRKDAELLTAFIHELTSQLTDLSSIQLPQPTEDLTPTLQQTLTELTARRTRLIDAYETGSLPITEYTQRVSSINSQIIQTEKDLTRQTDNAATHIQRLQNIGGIAGILQHTPDFLLNAPAQHVNAQLRTILQKITITPTTVELTFIL